VIDVAYWPDSEVSECPNDFRFLRYSGLVVLTASLSESDPLRSFGAAFSSAGNGRGEKSDHSSVKRRHFYQRHKLGEGFPNLQFLRLDVR
jgi:hypothetical protein